MSKRCYIVGAGDFSNRYVPKAGDFIIAADAGLTHLEKAGIVPDIVVGDFDSLGVVPNHLAVMQSPAEKDDTDMVLAVNEALSRGYEFLIIDGGLGGRQDHTMANYQVLVSIASRGARAVLLGKDMCVTAVKNGVIRFLPMQQEKKSARADVARTDVSHTDLANAEMAESNFISVFCMGSKAEGVNISGLKYTAENVTLTYDYPIGVSNEFTCQAAQISVESGTLLVMWSGEFERLEI